MKRLKKAYLEITNVCNLNCSFCPGTGREKTFLTPAQFGLLAARLRPHTDYLYLHLMGEPLLHPQLPALLDLAGSLDFKVMVTTNGTLLPRCGADLLAAAAVARVSISLHSFEGNEGVDSADYLAACLDFARRAGEGGKRCVLRLWNLDGAHTRGANRQNAAILREIAAVFPPPWKSGRRGETLAQGVYLEWGERFDWPDLTAPEGAPTGFCMGLRDQVGVLCDGTVVPCCLDHEGDIPLGNLYEQTLAEILDSPRAQAIYHGFSHGKITEELCRKCGFMRRFS